MNIAEIELPSRSLLKEKIELKSALNNNHCRCNHFILVRVLVDPESTPVTGCEMGLYPGWDAIPFHVSISSSISFIIIIVIIMSGCYNYSSYSFVDDDDLIGLTAYSLHQGFRVDTHCNLPPFQSKPYIAWLPDWSFKTSHSEH